ncbi:MAG: oxidoreductase, partial [Candidatus Methanomethylophilaceae archaeon]|nr:oxidoreductase [Candidatus Methanomethylophilaceae archaeon]
MSFFDRFKKKDNKKEEPKVDNKEKFAVKKDATAPSLCGCGAGKTAESVEANYSKMADLGELLPGAPPGGKINLAIYWAAACGGCDVSILDTNEKILTIGDMANIVMWPIAADGKEKDIEAMEDKSITVSIISGAIRNSENEHMAKLLRKKSLIVVSYGTCACFGGSPALANLVAGGSKEILNYVYEKTPSTANFQKDYHPGKPIVPQTKCTVPEGDLTLPTLFDTVKTLDQVIDVD